MSRSCLLLGLTLSILISDTRAGEPGSPPGKAFRTEKNGWIFVHLEGSPDEIGYQHGWLLSGEIADLIRVCKPFLEKTTRRYWSFYRHAAETMLWPKTDPEYQREIDGIVAGLKARGIAADRWDLVALNALEELPYYYVPWLDK